MRAYHEEEEDFTRGMEKNPKRLFLGIVFILRQVSGFIIVFASSGKLFQ